MADEDHIRRAAIVVARAAPDVMMVVVGDRRSRRRADGSDDGFPLTPLEWAAVRLSAVIDEVPPSEPLLLAALPPLVLDLLTAGHEELPDERCVDDCLVLAYAYAHLGVVAHVRVAELAMTDIRTGRTTIHSSLPPSWRDGLLDGHTVVWLPSSQILVDPTLRQYLPDTGHEGGPLVTRTESVDEERGLAVIETHRQGQLLTYVLAPRHLSTQVLDHPVVGDDDRPYVRRGINVASAVVEFLAENLPPHAAASLPAARAAALVAATRELPTQRTADGDHRFSLAESDGSMVSVRLDEIPLPVGTPRPRRVALLPGGR